MLVLVTFLKNISLLPPSPTSSGEDQVRVTWIIPFCECCLSISFPIICGYDTGKNVNKVFNDHVLHPFTTPIRKFLMWRILCVVSSQMAPCYTGLELVTTMQCRAIRRSLPQQIIFNFMYYHYRFYILSFLFIYVVLLLLCMVGSLFCFCNLLPHYSSQHLQLLPTNGIKSYLSHWCFYTRYTASFVILSLNYDYEYYWE